MYGRSQRVERILRVAMGEVPPTSLRGSMQGSRKVTTPMWEEPTKSVGPKDYQAQPLTLRAKPEDKETHRRPDKSHGPPGLQDILRALEVMMLLTDSQLGDIVKETNRSN